MEASKSHKSLVFDGTHNVKEFITKCQLECSVKGYEDEKKANFLGCRLIGPAFDVYMRLSVNEKKKILTPLEMNCTRSLNREI